LCAVTSGRSIITGKNQQRIFGLAVSPQNFHHLANQPIDLIDKVAIRIRPAFADELRGRCNWELGYRDQLAENTEKTERHLRFWIGDRCIRSLNGFNPAGFEPDPNLSASG